MNKWWKDRVIIIFFNIYIFFFHNSFYYNFYLMQSFSKHFPQEMEEAEVTKSTHPSKFPAVLFNVRYKTLNVMEKKKREKGRLMKLINKQKQYEVTTVNTNKYALDQLLSSSLPSLSLVVNAIVSAATLLIGFGTRSWLEEAQKSPKEGSNAAFKNESINSLNRPPPSIPASPTNSTWTLPWGTIIKKKNKKKKTKWEKFMRGDEREKIEEKNRIIEIK